MWWALRKRKLRFYNQLQSYIWSAALITESCFHPCHCFLLFFFLIFLLLLFPLPLPPFSFPVPPLPSSSSPLFLLLPSSSFSLFSLLTTYSSLGFKSLRSAFESTACFCYCWRSMHFQGRCVCYFLLTPTYWRCFFEKLKGKLEEVETILKLRT